HDRPFFLYLAATIPHANNEAGDHGLEAPSDRPYSARDWPQQQKNLAALVTRLDSDVGRIAAQLKALGIDRDTLIIFTSDNGPHREGGNDPDFFASSGPYRGIKRDLYEGGIRAPLIARWPGRIEPGSTSGHVSAFWDFLPTACEIARVQPPEDTDGISYLAELTGGSQPRHEYLYWEFHEGPASKQAVRLGNWKGIRLRPSGKVELYDLASDIGETEYLASGNPEVVRKIERIMDSARSESTLWPLVDRT
ncbi:MAG TPA: sulfatase-like hydrolase/transferase, partial [Candidatus Glassbacteria bacterium]|nr:sulfatase-like hydrolase/transferase [Candidatus Glassbacteria bacterium]